MDSTRSVPKAMMDDQIQHLMKEVRMNRNNECFSCG